MRTPDFRYQQVKTAVDAAEPCPVDLSSAALYLLLTDQPCPIEEVAYAYDLFSVPEHRAHVDAFVLSGTPLAIAERAMGIPAAVIGVYASLFMDASVFRNKLELRTFAAEYPGEEKYREIVRVAVFIGHEYLLWMLGTTPDNVDARYIIRKTMVDSYMRSMAHKGNALTSAVTKEAQKWLSTAVRNSELIERLDPQTSKAAADELKIALVQKDDTYTAETSPVRIEEILH